MNPTHGLEATNLLIGLILFLVGIAMSALAGKSDHPGRWGFTGTLVSSYGVAAVLTTYVANGMVRTIPATGWMFSITAALAIASLLATIVTITVAIVKKTIWKWGLFTTAVTILAASVFCLLGTSFWLYGDQSMQHPTADHDAIVMHGICLIVMLIAGIFTIGHGFLYGRIRRNRR